MCPFFFPKLSDFLHRLLAVSGLTGTVVVSSLRRSLATEVSRYGGLPLRRSLATEVSRYGGLSLRKSLQYR